MKKTLIITALSFTACVSTGIISAAQSQLLRCPIYANYGGAVIKPVYTQMLLECKHRNGSTYYSRFGQFTVKDKQQWTQLKQPDALICLGREPEHCQLYGEELQ